MNTIIERLDGTQYDLAKLKIYTRDIIPSSPTPETTYEKATGGQGSIDMGTTYGPRDLRGVYYMEAADLPDYPMMRDEVFALFNSLEPFYLYEVRNGAMGKRWLVKVANKYEIDQQRIYGLFEISFISASSFAESAGTTLNPFEWDADTWQWGMGIPYDDYEYEHSTNLFTIYNAGTETVNPRSPHMKLRIEIKAAASQYLELINHASGDIYRYDGSLTTNDTLVIDGIRSTKNSLSVFRNTNGRLISLVPGENHLEVRGAQVERILFDFRFYYS